MMRMRMRKVTPRAEKADAVKQLGVRGMLGIGNWVDEVLLFPPPGSRFREWLPLTFPQRPARRDEADDPRRDAH